MNADAVGQGLRSGGFEGRVETDVELARFTTYRLGGPAALYVEPAHAGDLEVLGKTIGDHPDGDVPILAMGRGSNLVISDSGFPGVVVRLGGSFSWIEPLGADGGVTSGSATTMPQLANWAARRGLGGLEWMIAIPGSVGGGVRMNAGAHGGDVSGSLVSVKVFSLSIGTMQERSADELGFDYRRSNLTATDLVVEARFALTPEPADQVRARMESYRKHRAETQPGALQNAGSVFKNPPGDSAGRLVEQAGLKGFSIGGASVSELHANFFIAGEGATSQDVRDLVRAVRKRVKETSGVDLKTEIRFIGAFTGQDEL